MQIVMLSHTYPPLLGGIERHVRNLSRALVQRGHQVAVVTLASGDLPAYEEDEGVRVYRIRGTIHRLERMLFQQPGRSYAPPVADPELTRAIGQVLQRERPTIVHAHNWLVHSYLPLARRSPARLVVTLHDYGLICARWNLMERGQPCPGPSPLRCLACGAREYGALKGPPTVALNWLGAKAERRMVDAFIAVSGAVARINRLDAEQARVEIIPNFIADEVEPGGAGEAPIPAGALLFVGALARSKGLPTLLAAYDDLRRSSIDPLPPLALIGYATGDMPLDQASLPPGVSVLTDQPNDVVLRAWQACSLGVVPSVWPEPCPTVAMEAMAMGKPLVASDVGGLPDLVAHGETGFLVPPGDPLALRNALAMLVSNPELCATMGAAARQRVAAFRASAVVGKIETLYKQLTYATRTTA
jgi:glycosyltransferase involved in cell wall biosynthesis